MNAVFRAILPALLAGTLFLAVGCTLIRGTGCRCPDSGYVCAPNGNVCMVYPDGSMRQVTRSGRDSAPVLAPDGKLVVFVRQVAEFSDNPHGVPEDDAAMLYACWSPYEIWCADLETGTVRVLLTSQYAVGVDGKENRGWFYDLCFAPDGQTLYYACQPACPTTNAIRAVDRDGSNDRWLCWGDHVDVIDDPADPHYGCLRVKTEEADGSYTYVIYHPDGHDIGGWRE